MNNLPEHLTPNNNMDENTEGLGEKGKKGVLHYIQEYEPLWDTWYLDSLLGKGSFGSVYRAYRDAFGKTYYSAIKIISVPSDDVEMRQMRNDGYDKASLQRFLHALLMDLVHEIDLMNELRGNSHVVSFDDYKVIEKSDGIGWDLLIRMELLTNMADHALQHPLDPPEVVKLGIHICRALELCAQKNIIHRDIKPDNIFVSQYGDYKLGDFGIARQLEHTMAGLSKKGTYSYMAPEVFRGELYGANVDTYSLGIVMYRLLNQGRLPFLPKPPQIIMPSDREIALQKRISGEPLPSLKDVNPALNTLILKACAYDRNQRFATPTEMREALENITRIPFHTSSTTVRQDPPPSVRQAYKSLSAKHSNTRNQVLLIVSLCATVLLLLGAGIFINILCNPTTLNLSNQNITDADLAAKVKNGKIPQSVKTLNLSTNQISDLTPLQSLPNLTDLNLADNDISNVDPLKTMLSLTKLDLQNNKLIDLDPLKFLTGLTHLHLDSNQITDVKPLAPMTQLTFLGLNNNKITSLDSLKSLTQLTELYLNANTVYRLSPLEQLTKLTHLALDDNGSMSSLTSLEKLTELKELHLNNMTFYTIDPLKSLTKLEKLYASKLTAAQILELKTTLPGCTIYS